VSIAVALGVFLVVAAASASATVSGFGFALLSVPLLGALIGPKNALVVTTVIGVGTSGLLAYRLRSDVRARVVVRLMGGALLGMPVGLLVLSGVDDRALRIIVSVVVAVSAALLLARVRLPLRGRRAEVLVGAVSGVLSTTTGTNGPPIAIALQSQGYEPRPFRATMAATLCLANVFAIGLLGSAGVITDVARTAIVLTVPAAFGGLYIGGRLAPRIPAESFRHLVIILLFLSAGSGVAVALLR
jgi:uncharacterized protein